MTTLDEYTKSVHEHKRHAAPAVVNMSKVAALNLTPQTKSKTAQGVTIRKKALTQLEEMVGLRDVKKSVCSLSNQMKFLRRRKELQLPVAETTQHYVFMGNPGTGKTSVARILGGILQEEGYLPRGHVVECQARDLIGEYVGGTAPKVMQRVEQAMGGVLFIDEAYALLHAVGMKSSFTDEAVAALLGAMENYRGQFTVVAAGYPQEMLRFIESNPGLKSRFTQFIEFGDYDAAELEAIFVQMAEDLCYKIDPGARTSLKWVMERGLLVFHRNFPNGRFVRNLFEATIRTMANRLEARLDVGADLTRSDMTVIMGGDVDAAWQEMLHMPK